MTFEELDVTIQKNNDDIEALGTQIDQESQALSDLKGQRKKLQEVTFELINIQADYQQLTSRLEKVEKK